MKSKKETFGSLLTDFEYHFDLKTVFDDFLTMSLCAMGMNPHTKKSYDEDLYLETIAKYKEHDLRHHFPKMFASLTLEMEENLGSHSGNDVLGDTYMQHFSKKGLSQFFTPWTVCEFMARAIADSTNKEKQRVIDQCCGSGRLLVCGARNLGREHDFFGIDIDHTCVKMTAINLFLNGIFHGEIMWGDALSPNDFRTSYKLSFLPFGVFRIKEKEKSMLWHINKSAFEHRRPDTSNLTLPSEDNTTFDPNASQLTLF